MPSVESRLRVVRRVTVKVPSPVLRPLKVTLSVLPVCVVPEKPVTVEKA
jgi:hypothetical protein